MLCIRWMTSVDLNHSPSTVLLGSFAIGLWPSFATASTSNLQVLAICYTSTGKLLFKGSMRVLVMPEFILFIILIIVLFRRWFCSVMVAIYCVICCFSRLNDDSGNLLEIAFFNPSSYDTLVFMGALWWPKLYLSCSWSFSIYDSAFFNARLLLTSVFSVFDC